MGAWGGKGGFLFQYYPTNIMSSACFYVSQFFLSRCRCCARRTQETCEPLSVFWEFYGCILDDECARTRLRALLPITEPVEVGTCPICLSM
jgi:hypothetical protein